jgi:hypothetical protein
MLYNKNFYSPDDKIAKFDALMCAAIALHRPDGNFHTADKNLVWDAVMETAEKAMLLSDEELLTLYKDTVRTCRYYHNTDDPDNYRREEKDRKAADAEYNKLLAEIKQRGLEVPNVS